MRSNVLRKIDQNYNTIYIKPTSMKPACDWDALRMQLLQQWSDLGYDELEESRMNFEKIAELIAIRKGLPQPVIENYLHNLERTLPLS